MQYISPLSLLRTGNNTELSSKDIKLAKQRLMAEFELTGNTTIELGGKELSRSDVLRMFDKLERSDKLQFDMLVAADTALLHFLEHAEMQPSRNFSIPDDKVTPEFIEWISPYFSRSFKKATTRIFRTVNRAEFDTLIVNTLMMTEKDAWEAWSGTEAHMQQMLHEFEQINGSKYYTLNQIARYAGYDLVCLLCNLPAYRFQKLLNDYAFEIMQLAIREFNKQNRTSAFELMAYARSLQVSEDLMRSILDKENEMQGLVKKERKSIDTRNLWNVLRVIFLIIFVVSRLATCKY